MRCANRVAISVLSLAISIAHGSAQAVDLGPDKTIVVLPDDPEMAVATATARAKLDEFLALAEAPAAGTERFKLKVKIAEGNVTEHLWVLPFRRTGTGFVGIVANEPVQVRTVVYGQNIEFGRDDISDWGYMRDGRQVGSFTVCVMLTRMAKEDAEETRQQYGLDC